MGLEIHAIGPDGSDDMVRHFSIWNYRRCVAIAGYTAELLSKEELESEFRQTADLQLFSRIELDDDGNYKNPIGNVELDLDMKIEKDSDKETQFLYVETLRDDDLVPEGAIVRLGSDMFANLPQEAISNVMASMLNQQRATEELLCKVIGGFVKAKKLKLSKKEIRQLAMNASETSDVLLEGHEVRLIGMVLSHGMFKHITEDKEDQKKVLEEVFESWEEVGSIAAFCGVWMQSAQTQRVRIK